MQCGDSVLKAYLILLSSSLSGVQFTPHNVLERVRVVEDWWSKGDDYCIGGGLAYWLAVSSARQSLIKERHTDPDEQKMKLIECWMELDGYASWHRLSRALWRVGQTELASLVVTYEQPPTGTCTSTYMYLWTS